MKWTHHLLFATLCSLSLGLQAQGMSPPSSGSKPSAATPPLSDKDFATKAAQDGLAEVAMGKLAEQRASDPAVKQFGQTMVKDHAEANKRLEKVAQTEGIKLPTKPSSEQEKTLEELSRLSGSQFDQRYVQEQIKDHQKAVDLFQSEADNGRSVGIKNFAKETLPKLQTHLDMAKGLSAGKPAR